MFSDTLANPLRNGFKVVRVITQNVGAAAKGTPSISAGIRAAQHPPSAVGANLANGAMPASSLPTMFRAGVESGGANMATKIASRPGAVPTSAKGLAATIAESATAFHPPTDATSLQRFNEMTKNLNVMHVVNAAALAYFIYDVQQNVLKEREFKQKLADMGWKDDDDEQGEAFSDYLRHAIMIVNPNLDL